MGQCPMIPPSFDERNMAEISDGEHEFLATHEFDDPERMLTDLDEVLVALNYQHHQIIRLKQQQARDDQLDDGTRTDVTAPSSFAVSNLAATSVTLKITNSDRYALKSKLKKQSSQGKKRTAPRLSDGMSTELKYEIEKIDEEQSSQKASGCMGPSRLLPSFFGLKSVRTPGDYDLSKVLYLKMKANFLDFYRDEYSSMFPGNDMAIGTPKQLSTPRVKGKYNSPPKLISSDTDSSLSTSEERPFASDGSAVSFEVDDTSFLDLIVSGSFGLFDRAHASSSGKQSASSTPSENKQKNPHHYLVLTNQRSGEPLAVCALKSPQGPPVVRIYATKPMIQGQQAAATLADVGLSSSSSSSSLLYPWAELVSDGASLTNVRYSVYMATGSNGKFEKEPSYTGTHIDGNSPGLVMMGRTAREQTYRGCCLLTVRSDGFFSLSISRGLDPALFICLAAIFDETTEHTMRKQCNAHARRLLKRLKRKQANDHFMRRHTEIVDRVHYS